MSKMLSKDEVVAIIIRETDYTEEDIIKMINETIETMDNMVNEEGAAFVVANNLGVSINPRKIVEALKVDQLVPGQSNITIIGKINRIYAVREFSRKDKTTGKVRNLELIDNTGKARVSLWDMKTKLVEEKSLQVGDIVKLFGGNTKIGYQDTIEITLTPRGSIDKETSSLESDFPSIEHSALAKLVSVTPETKSISIVAKIIDRQTVVEFQKGDKTGRVTSLLMDDGSKKMRLVFWNDLVDTALQYEKGEVIKALDLRVGVNKSGEIELTYADYSSIDREVDHSQFNEIQMIQDIIIASLSDIKQDMKGLTVIGKFVSKSDIRTFDRDSGTGKVANIVIKDSSQSIRVNLWGDATNYLTSMEEGCLIRIHKANSTLSDFSGEVELSCNERSKIEISTDEVDADLFDSDVSIITFSDITMAKSGVNVKISITNVSDTREITRNDGSTSQVKNFSVIDKNGIYGRIAAWDENINKVKNVAIGDVLLLSSVKVKPSSGTYGPEIVIQTFSEIEKQPDSDEFKNVTPQSQNVYDTITLDDTDKLNTAGSKLSFSGIIDSVDNFRIYDSCSECARKVFRSSELEDIGECDNHGEVKITPKMVLTLIISDDVGSAKVTLFNDHAEKLFGFNANDAKDMIERLGEQEAPIKKSEIVNSKINIEGSVSYNENRDEYSIRINNFTR
ncbi:MAG: hypothetical protein GPJ54_13685 [Candidatus Heimdallarchaeota archaeon]|nr:hypothetical protein [Candidatus Heimdallarchaeota archaeon]